MSKNQGAAVSGAIIGGLVGGVPGAIVGGIIGSALQELVTCPRCGSAMSYQHDPYTALYHWICRACGYRKQ
jgi:ribosomal protein S27AE